MQHLKMFGMGGFEMNREQEKKRLVELCEDVVLSCKSSLCADCEHNKVDYPHCMSEHFADYLLANGIVVPKCNPIGVMTDGNEFNSDVYCPYCGNNLSGLYGDEPTPIIQCYGCGEFLDNTKTITREEVEKMLKGVGMSEKVAYE